MINDGETGLLVKKNDWKEAATRVIELLNGEEKRNKLIKNGKNTVRERFDARRVSEECEVLYRAIL